MYDVVYPEWAKIKAKAENEQIQANAKESLKSGLKSKLERQLELQKLLDDGQCESCTYDFKSQKVIRYFRKLEPLEIKALHAELSKMGGDYAPAKVAQTDTDGNNTRPYTPQQVSELAEAWRQGHEK